MDISEITAQENSLVTDIKRQCRFCMGRAHLPTNKGLQEKAQVQSDLKQLYSVFENKFNALRKKDYDERQIQDAATNKRFVLDVIPLCEGCDREIDRASRAMLSLR